MSEVDRQLANAVDGEIEHSIATYFKWWKIFGRSSSVLGMLSIVISFIAGVCVAADVFGSKLWQSLLAGLPALFLTLDQYFRLREMSNWYWDLVLRYQKLRRQLDRGDINYEQASRLIDDIEEEANARDPSRRDRSPESGIQDRG